MGLIETLLGKKMFCSACGAPIVDSQLQDKDGKPLCSVGCSSALELLSQSPLLGASENDPAPANPMELFGQPELTVYVFGSKDPAPFYSLQEQILESFCEPTLRVERLDGLDVSLVVVVGPVGSIHEYRRVVRDKFGPLAEQAHLRLEKIRPSVTYSNVGESGDIRPADPSILSVCEKIRRGVFQRVFQGPPSVPPSSSAPVLRAMTDDLLLENALAMVERHVAFFPGGVFKVESDGVREAGLLFGELARRRPDDPDPVYLEAAALCLGMRRGLADEKLRELRSRFPDHIDGCVLEVSGQSVFAYPPYSIGQPIPGSLQERISGVNIAMTREGRHARPVLFAELGGRPMPWDSEPIARPSFANVGGVPIVLISVAFTGKNELELDCALAGFEEHEGNWSTSPRACYLFHIAELPVVLCEDGNPVRAVHARFEKASHQAFLDCEARFRALQPRSIGHDELDAILANMRSRASALPTAPPTQPKVRMKPSMGGDKP